MTLPSHLGKLRPGDYAMGKSVTALGKESSEPKYLPIKVLKLTADTVIGTYLRDQHIKDQTIELRHDELVCNFGPTLPVGDAFRFNFDHGVLRLTKEHSTVGRVNFFYDPEKEVGKKLWASYDHVSAWLVKNGLSSILDAPIVHDVVNKKSKYAGMFQPSRDLRKAPCRIIVNVEDLEARSLNTLDYVLFHEYAHAIDCLLLTSFPKHRAKWLNLYMATVEPLDVPVKTASALLKTLTASPNVKEWLSTIEDDEAKNNAKSILKYLNAVRGVSTRELDMLLAVDEASSIEDVWPDAKYCVSRSPKPVISEYATKNVKETIAEAISFYASGAKLPAKVSELVETALGLASKAGKGIKAQGGWLVEPSTDE